MNIDLLSILEKNKEIEKEQEKVNIKKELKSIVVAIIEGLEEYNVTSKTLIDNLGVKYTVRKKPFYPYFPQMLNNGTGDYTVKLNKTNIAKIQKYLDKEAKDND